MKAARESDPRLRSAKEHEILSYLIITCSEFRRYFDDHIRPLGADCIDLDRVADMVVGHVSDDDRAYLVDIISGPFDADKLDYIHRDAHCSGIKMVLDLDRLMHTLGLVTDDRGRRRLSLDMSGLTSLEQLVFNKMILFRTVYRHHKVRAAACLFRSIMMDLRQHGGFRGSSLSSAADFLQLTDPDITSLEASAGSGLAGRLAADLRRRTLPKRGYVINRYVIEPKRRLGDLLKLQEDPQLVDVLQKHIAAACPAVPTESIWLDIPAAPKFAEAIQCPVRCDGTKYGFRKLRRFIPVDAWVRSFSINQWQGYVFTQPEHLEMVFNGTVEVLADMGITTTHSARAYTRLPVPVGPV